MGRNRIPAHLVHWFAYGPPQNFWMLILLCSIRCLRTCPEGCGSINFWSEQYDGEFWDMLTFWWWSIYLNRSNMSLYPSFFEFLFPWTSSRLLTQVRSSCLPLYFVLESQSSAIKWKFFINALMESLREIVKNMSVNKRWWWAVHSNL